MPFTLPLTIKAQSKPIEIFVLKKYTEKTKNRNAVRKKRTTMLKGKITQRDQCDYKEDEDGNGFDDNSALDWDMWPN